MYITYNQQLILNYTKNTTFPKPSKFDFGRKFPKICEIFDEIHRGNLRKMQKIAEKPA